MLNFIVQVRAATMHSTDDLSVLLLGLTGLIWFSVGMLVVATVYEGLRSKQKHLADEGPTLVNYREQHNDCSFLSYSLLRKKTGGLS